MRSRHAPEIEAFRREFANHPDHALRNAFLQMEERLREATGLSAETYGVGLVDAVFKPNDGLLQPFSPSEIERRGIHDLFKGAFKYYRNPLSHRHAAGHVEHKQHLGLLVELLFTLIEQAIDQAINLDQHVGLHEGQVVSRRSFRLDIDGDSEPEVVVLMQMSPVARDGQLHTSHFMHLILDRVDNRWVRVPSTAIPGNSMYGPIAVQLECVTDSDRPDLAVTWTSGESGWLVYVLHWNGQQYVPATIGQVGPDGTIDQVKTSIGLLERHDVRFVDFDGDGRSEIEIIRAVSDLAGFKLLDDSSTYDGQTEETTCTVLKWSPIHQLLEIVSQTVQLSSR